MWKDPIVEEIHAVREQIARECDYDLNQIIARLKKKEGKHTNRLVYHGTLSVGHQEEQEIQKRVA